VGVFFIITDSCLPAKWTEGQTNDKQEKSGLSIISEGISIYHRKPKSSFLSAITAREEARK